MRRCGNGPGSGAAAGRQHRALRPWGGRQNLGPFGSVLWPDKEAGGEVVLFRFRAQLIGTKFGECGAFGSTVSPRHQNSQR